MSKFTKRELKPLYQEAYGRDWWRDDSVFNRYKQRLPPKGFSSVSVKRKGRKHKSLEEIDRETVDRMRLKGSTWSGSDEWEDILKETDVQGKPLSKAWRHPGAKRAKELGIKKKDWYILYGDDETLTLRFTKKGWVARYRDHKNDEDWTYKYPSLAEAKEGIFRHLYEYWKPYGELK